METLQEDNKNNSWNYVVLFPREPEALLLVLPSKYSQEEVRLHIWLAMWMGETSAMTLLP